MITVLLVIFLITCIAYLIKICRDINQTWERKGIKHEKPLLFFGNCLPMVLNKKSQIEILEDLFKKFPNELVLGFYDFMTARLFVRDPDLIQKVLIKDFTHFTDHGISLDVEKNPTEDQLFFMTGTRWRAFRTKISPIFTSGKLRDMYTTMTSCGENLLDYLDQRKNEDIDIKEVMGLFSMDVIGGAVFGMDPGTLKNPDCEFRTVGKRLGNLNLKSLIRLWILFSFPNLFQKLGIAVQDPKVTQYYLSIIRKNFELRKEQGGYRNDFTQMLMMLKEKGKVEIANWDPNDDYLKSDNDTVGNLEQYEITEDLILAQAQGFMLAGFEATSNVLTYALFEMAQSPQVQEKLREEIFEQVKLHNGLTYDALRNMKYLEATVKETLRLYTLVPVLFRVCTKEYVLPDGYVIKKGDQLSIPVTAVHMDPNNYPEPKVFKPERFLEPIKSGIFIPFGEGPRICIGMRYALMVVKYGIALFFMNYNTTVSDKTPVPLKFKKRSFALAPEKKLYIKIEKKIEQ